MPYPQAWQITCPKCGRRYYVTSQPDTSWEQCVTCPASEPAHQQCAPPPNLMPDDEVTSRELGKAWMRILWDLDGRIFKPGQRYWADPHDAALRSKN